MYFFFVIFLERAVLQKLTPFENILQILKMGVFA